MDPFADMPTKDLDDIVEYLAENPGTIYISKNRSSALVYYPPADRVVFVVGDFSGDEESCMREIEHMLPDVN